MLKLYKFSIKPSISNISSISNILNTYYSRLDYINSIIRIQKIWRGYKSRKIINNIYRKLPCDIQLKIKYMVSTQYYINKYNNSVIKIIYKRLDWLIDTISRIDIFDFNHMYDSYVNIINTIILYVKYINYIDDNKKFTINSLIMYFYDMLTVILTEKLYVLNKKNYLKYQNRYRLNINYDNELIEYINKKNYEILYMTIYTIEYYSKLAL